MAARDTKRARNSYSPAARQRRKEAAARKRAAAKAGAAKSASPLAALFQTPDNAVERQSIPTAGEPESKRKSILKLEASDCRWPTGDPRSEDFSFCGHRKVAGLPYCSHHAMRAYQPPSEKRTKTCVSHAPGIKFDGGASKRNEVGSGKATHDNENHATARANEFDEVES